MKRKRYSGKIFKKSFVDIHSHSQDRLNARIVSEEKGGCFVETAFRFLQKKNATAGKSCLPSAPSMLYNRDKLGFTLNG
jgi:hypothetical protein